jgi:putative ABC transport system substrate-binding protein
MRRRAFITLLGGAATAWPLAARAQQPGTISRVGYLTAGQFENNPEAQARQTVFREAMEKLGWADGRNVRIEYRQGGIGFERLRASVAELIGLSPDVIVTEGTPMSDALRRETRTIPIVFVSVSDPFSLGLVEGMAHPGRNFTGFANYLFSIGGKWLQTLKEVAPGIKRTLVILQPGDIAHQGFLRAIEAAAPALGVQPVEGAARDAGEVARAIDTFAREPDSGLLVLPGLPGRDNSELIIELAARHHLPAIYTQRFFTARGGLMSYDTDTVDLVRRAASYVDRLLRGEKPGDLPVQLPTKYDLVINLKTAKTLGVTVPFSLLANADEVIE